MLQIRLLGQFDVRLDGRRILIPSRAGQSLLAYLVLTAGLGHRREKLAGIFWPDTTDETARKNLRHELWRLRKAVSGGGPSPEPDYLLADEFTLKFSRDADYWLDVAQLERADQDLQALLANLSLYQGELLAGFYDDWISIERERVNAVFDARMEQLLEQLVTAERWIGVQEWAERWLTFSGPRETAYRALMLASGVRGDMAKVGSLYKRCTDELHESLGVEPSAETHALYDGLLKGAKTHPRTTAAQPAGTITFLFTDIEGSTRLLDRLGEKYAVVLSEHHEIMRAAIRKWNGREMETQGDAFFVTFSRAIDAIQCAAEAQRALAGNTWLEGETLRVRMGLHTGEPLIAATGYVGMDIHRAARIGDAGHGGQILLSQTTRELVIQDLPAGMTIRDLGEHRLKDLKYPTAIYQLVVAGLAAEFAPIRTKFTGTEAPLPGEAPFKGLQFFDEGDSALFFGREDLTEKLVDRLDEAKFLSVIIGASGSGKSSLARAGLISAIKRRNPDWQVHVITPAAHPLEALALVLTRDSESVTAAATLTDDLSNDPRSLHFFLARQVQSGGVSHALLVIDQFEELFTLCRDEFEKEAFIDNLLTALTPASPPLGEERKGEGHITLVITLRADFYAHLAQYPELRAAVAQQQEYIGPMTSEELRRAIEEPARRGRWDFEPGLVDLILRDVGDEPGALPLLSHALLETWKRRAGHMLTLKGYAEAGGVRGAIAHTAESLYRTLSPDEQAITRSILLRLTEFGEGTEDTRRRASFEELLSQSEDTDQARAVLNRLAEARLVTLSEDAAEVAHEALIREWPQLREWLSQDREGIILHRRLTEAAQEWELLERDAGSLYRGARLAQAREWSAVDPGALNSRERAFLAASIEQEDREALEREVQRERQLQAARKLAESETRSANRLRRRAVYLAGALGLVIIALFAAGLLANRAEAQRKLANSRELALAANVNLGIDPELSMMLALRALDLARMPEAENALHGAVQTSRAHITLQYGRPVWNLAYSPDADRLATLSGESPEHSVTIWDTTTWQKLRSIPAPDAFSVQFSHDGKRLVTNNGSEVDIWDAATGKLLLGVAPHTEFIGGSALSPDGTLLATASDDYTVKVLDAFTGKELRTFRDHSTYVNSVDFSPDGTRLASGDNDFKVIVHDLASGKQVLGLYGYFAVYTPDGKGIMTGGPKGSSVWDAVTGEELYKLAEHGGGGVFSPDSTQIIDQGPRTGWVMVRDVATGEELLSFPAHADGTTGIAVSPDGIHLATSSTDGTVKVWDLSPEANREWLTISAPGPGAYSPDGSLLATSGPDNTAALWDAETGEQIVPLVERRNKDLVGPGGQPCGMGPGPGSFSPDGSRLATVSCDRTASVWDAETGKELLRLSKPGHGDGVYGDIYTGLMAVAYSPDGKRLATGGADGTVVFWDPATGEPGLTLDNEGAGISGLAFSPDGTRIATAGDSDIVRMWDTMTGKELFRVDAGDVRVFGLAFSPDGKRLATGDFGGLLQVWDALTGKNLLSLHAHDGWISGLRFSPNGSLLASSGADGIAKLWDASTLQDLLTLHTGGDGPVLFSPDGKRLATAGENGKVLIYLVNVDDLIALAQSRLTRSLTTEECQQYLHLDTCPEEP
jgi:WD40 repeat protein/class 3 adenylate cyclase